MLSSSNSDRLPETLQENSSQYQSDINMVIYSISTRSLLHIITVKVYGDRLSIETRSTLGLWEHRETYSAVDIANIYINKGRGRAVVGATSNNTSEELFQIQNLRFHEAEELKDALDRLISFRYRTYTPR
ncbi:MAG: hypothetical protein ACE5DX_05200 [Candidatus Dojkabacteria bacterium]